MPPAPCVLFCPYLGMTPVFRRYTPREIPVTEIAEIIDTPENRYVKYFLEECALLAQWLASNLNAQGKIAAAREAGSWVWQLQELLAHDTWRSVGIMQANERTPRAPTYGPR